MRPRRGFALLVVLWTLVGAALLLALLDSQGRDGLALARNRAALTRSRWVAEGCKARVRAELDSRLGDRENRLQLWHDLDASIAPALAELPCIARLRSSGMRRDVNALDNAALHRLLDAAGMSAAGADSIAGAILDWRDADQTPRDGGAERAWYRTARMPTPRDGDVRSREELALVRGLAAHPEVLVLLGVEPERLMLDRAPMPVVASLPGMTGETLHRLAELREAHADLSTLGVLTVGISQASRATFMEHSVELAGLISSQPDAWYLTVDRAESADLPAVHVEVRLVLAGGTVAIGRWRTWT